MWVHRENLIRRMRFVMPTPGEDGAPVTVDMRMDPFGFGAEPDIRLPDPATAVDGPHGDPAAPSSASTAPHGDRVACETRAVFPCVAVRDARADERDALRELHRRSSLVWEANRPHLEAHPELFGVATEAIEEGRARVAVDADGNLLGFSVVKHRPSGVSELEDLFVDPAAMGQRVGARLVEDAAERAGHLGQSQIAVTANPDAIGFYERVGFHPGEEVPTRFRPGVRMRRTIRG